MRFSQTCVYDLGGQRAAEVTEKDLLLDRRLNKLETATEAGTMA
jgi:hypothetical protein